MDSSGSQSLLAALWRGFINIIFPAHCVLCAKPLSPDHPHCLCGACLEGLPRVTQPFCPVCGRPIRSKALVPFDTPCGECRGTSRRFQICRSAGVYEGTLRDALHLFKYDGRRELARALGLLMAEYARENMPGLNYDRLIPVPLHRGKVRERGFNQSLLLARELGKRLGIPVNGASLLRVRATPPQSALSRAGRLKNVRGAFTVKDGRGIRGMRCLLIDDVFTTGATAEACAHALVRAGARAVDVFTLARTAA
ncbi:MAG: ComF family protein [Candidatus Aureabacteria bacterium]|nr:ComF family protein [Candidatus Auribacterota bacterium]